MLVMETTTTCYMACRIFALHCTYCIKVQQVRILAVDAHKLLKLPVL